MIDNAKNLFGEDLKKKQDEAGFDSQDLLLGKLDSVTQSYLPFSSQNKYFAF